MFLFLSDNAHAQLVIPTISFDTGLPKSTGIGSVTSTGKYTLVTPQGNTSFNFVSIEIFHRLTPPPAANWTQFNNGVNVNTGTKTWSHVNATPLPAGNYEIYVVFKYTKVVGGNPPASYNEMTNIKSSNIFIP